MHSIRSLVCLCGLVGVVGRSCFGFPNTFFFEVSNVITPEQPSATISLWAAFDPKWFAFHETQTAVFTEFDRGWFSDPTARLNNDGFSDPGTVSPDGNRVQDVYIMQLYIPFSHYPEIGSPISLWTVTWTTDDFTSRQVDLATASESFWVYHEDGGWFDMFGTDFAEGLGVITVVPAPASAPLVLAVVAMAGRRARSGSTT